MVSAKKPLTSSSYLMNPPVLQVHVPRKPLILYQSTIEDSVGTVLAQHDDSGKERAVYYLSRLFNPSELKLTTMEKTCAALVWVVQKLNHYFLAHRVSLISRMDPIRYLLEKPVLADRLAHWQRFLSQFDITFIV